MYTDNLVHMKLSRHLHLTFLTTAKTDRAMVTATYLQALGGGWGKLTWLEGKRHSSMQKYVLGFGGFLWLGWENLHPIRPV